MLAGFYSSATGMISQSIAMDHITENISNSLVPGYKKQEVIFHSFDEDLYNEVLKTGPFGAADFASGIDIIQGVTDFSQGAFRSTDNNHDFAIDGEGFFKFDTGNGQYFSRDGKFAVNSKYELVTKDGFHVLSDEGAKIVFDSAIPNVASTFQVRDDGTIISIDTRVEPPKKTEVAKLGMFDFEEVENLERIGYGLWDNKDNQAGVKDSTSNVRQGYEELSNANAVESMVDMIYNQRLYESNSSALKTLHKSMQNFISAIAG